MSFSVALGEHLSEHPIDFKFQRNVLISFEHLMLLLEFTLHKLKFSAGFKMTYIYTKNSYFLKKNKTIFELCVDDVMSLWGHIHVNVGPHG